MQRRSLLKTIGGIGTASAAGGAGVLALTGFGAASDADLETNGNNPIVVTTDDGEIAYVAYGGRLYYEWDGLDTEATYGEYEVETRVQRDDGSWTAWANHGAASGPLGDDPDNGHDGNGEFEHGEENTANSWGGNNDSNSGPGTDGFFEFRFGTPYNQANYAVVYDNEDDLDMDNGNPTPRAVPNAWSTSRFNETEDNGKRATTIEIRKTCRVYDGDPSNGGTELISDAASTKLTVEVNNRPATSNTGGEVEGSVGADTS